MRFRSLNFMGCRLHIADSGWWSRRSLGWWSLGWRSMHWLQDKISITYVRSHTAVSFPNEEASLGAASIRGVDDERHLR